MAKVVRGQRAAGVLVVFLLLGGLSIVFGLGGGEAGASTVTGTDPWYDTPAPEGDIVAWGVQAGGAANTTDFTVQTLAGSYASPYWSQGESVVIWLVDTNLDGKPEYDVALLNTGVALYAAVLRDGDGSTACDATAWAANTAARVTVANSCLGSPGTMRVFTGVQLDTNPANPGHALVHDYAPDSGWSATRYTGNPFGLLDTAAFSSPAGVSVSGWVVDPDGSPTTVHLYVDGALAGVVSADQTRNDIAAAYPGFGATHGFSTTLAGIGQGTHTICAYGINVGEGQNGLLSCRSVTVDHNPRGSLDGVTFGVPGLGVRGWALDPDTVTPATVHVYLDGSFLGTAPADQARNDIAAAFPGYGAAHGFTTAFAGVSQGTHTVCAYAINASAGTANTTLGCATVVVDHNPTGNLEAVNVGPTTTTLTGWALDRDTAAAVSVHVYVDGVYKSVVLADHVRNDVAAAFPGYGNLHGLQADIGLLPQGTHTVCAYAVNAGTGASNTTLGCRTVSSDHKPVGSLDATNVGMNLVQVRGWTLDPDTTGPVSIHIYVDGAFTTAATADQTRNDIATAFPGYGPLHGYDTMIGAVAGTHQVCTYAINTGPGSGNTTLGCRSYTK